jgi:hypothetical protein
LRVNIDVRLRVNVDVILRVNVDVRLSTMLGLMAHVLQLDTCVRIQLRPECKLERCMLQRDTEVFLGKYYNMLDAYNVRCKIMINTVTDLR